MGFDLQADTPLQVAQQAVAAYKDLYSAVYSRLAALGLKVNPKKTAFVATDKSTDHALKSLLTDQDPPVTTVMRDLGIDHQAARRRRIPVQPQRFQKAQQRKVRLNTLNIPALKIRLRLRKGGIQPVALWGLEAQGLAPRYHKAMRHHAGGLLDSTYDLHGNRYMDPADQILIHHIKAMHQLFHTWPEEQQSHIEQAWQAIHDQLHDKQYQWYTVRGHMAATITYMMEWKWQAHHLHRWTRPANDCLLENEISLHDPWWKVERALLLEAKQQRTARLAQQPHHKHLITGLDWHTFRQVHRTLPADPKPHLKTWVQAAIHYKEGGQPKPCPICHVPATPKHILWARKWHHHQKHKPMPPEWAERILHRDEEPLWSHGWIPLEPQEQCTVQHPYVGHGSWQDLQALAPHQYQGWAFTLDATPSTYDTRSQLWVFGLCVHHMTLGQLQRLGAITGIPSPPHNKTRALLAGLVSWHSTPPHRYES